MAVDFVATRVGDEEGFCEGIGIEFEGSVVDAEAEGFENPSDELEEAEPVAGANHEGG